MCRTSRPRPCDWPHPAPCGECWQPTPAPDVGFRPTATHPPETTNVYPSRDAIMTVASTPAIDLASIKRRQQTTWASGDYASVAARIPIVAERLCDAADIHAGDRVLDVATGTGNAALAAARCGAVVTGVDYVPALLDRGRIRATAEGLEVDYQEGDAEALSFADDSFDAVLSVFGVMFAPDQEKAAAELLRVCRPGGTIALACWTPDGFIGEMFRAMARHVPPPSGLRSPMEWGSEER